MPVADAAFDLVQLDEGLDVRSKHREIFRRSVSGVARHRCVDHGLRNARIHGPRRSVPTQHRVAVLAEMLAMRIEQRALAGVGANSHTATCCRVSSPCPGRTALIISTSGSALASSSRPKCQFVQ